MSEVYEVKMEEKTIEALKCRTDFENFSVGVENVVVVHVIVTYENIEQEVFDSRVLVKPINDSIDSQLQVEKQIITQIVNRVYGDKNKIVKLSLCFYVPFETEEELVRNGYGFMFRTNGKYYFRASERDEFEQDIVDSLNMCNEFV